MILRDYQLDLKRDIHAAWGRVRNVCAVMPCRSGKTALFSNILAEESGYSLVMVHRTEIIVQISLTLARWGVQHNIIGSAKLQQQCVKQHIIEFGKCYVSPSARVQVASVQTLVSRSYPWFNRVKLWVVDETHHCLRDSTWGKCIKLFPNARGLGVTATPCRADGKGLGHHADGVFHELVEGPDLRTLINMGMVADYRIFSPSSDVDLSSVKVGASGDYVQDGLRQAVHKSHLVGDIVQHYIKYAPGLLGITFTVDVESAKQQAEAFNAAGVPCKAVDGNTDPAIREQAIRDLRNGKIKMITNCDLFGEGTDLPAVEVAIFGRPTESYGLYVQQFCRPLTITDGKTHGIIIDPVQNIRIECNGKVSGRHPLPDMRQVWTLDRRERRTGKSERTTLRTCTECLGVYDKIEHGLKCPYCDYLAVPVERSGPLHVDGDLCELSPEVLEAMRGQIAAAANPPKFPYGASPAIIGALKKHHRERLEALEELKQNMMLWASGKTDIRRAQREFYLTFGVDVMTAQALPKNEAIELNERVKK